MSSNAQSADGAKVVQLLDDIIAKANRSRASDIHITPRESRYQVRFRVDGTLREVVQPNRALHAALISRLKRGYAKLLKQRKSKKV
mgnify:CR=1 FL=1